MRLAREPLPVDERLDTLVSLLRRDGAAVLTAPPGAGKTTRVPPALADAFSGAVWVLQPRRAAARLVAARIAAERGALLGDEVGYSTRFDRAVSERTRIEVLTEGLLARRLQRDPLLQHVGCVVVDEFHERSLEADFALAMLHEARQARPELHIVVMSATLDAEPVAAYLGAQIVRAEGRAFPVDIEWDPRPQETAPERRAALAAARLVGEHDGTVLVFLPGVAEIERAQRALSDVDLPAGTDVLPLHGRLDAEAQDRALADVPGRRIVLSTNLAETSVTLARVVCVVDTGLARVPRWDPAAGSTRLETVRISRASAAQRAGRAGRVRAGLARRLWTEADHGSLPAFDVPEVRRADLTPSVLQIRAWGSTPDRFPWFERPSEAALAAADGSLRALGLLDADALTPLGRLASGFPTHPRFAVAMLAAKQFGVVADVAWAVALAEGRDDAGVGGDEDDVTPRVRALARGASCPPEIRRTQQQLSRLAERADASSGGVAHPRLPPVVRALAAGFPDRFARRRAPGSERVLLASGSGAELARDSGVRRSEWLLAVVIEGRGGADPRVRLAIGLDPADLDAAEQVEIDFDSDRGALRVRAVRRVGAVVLSERPAVGNDDALDAAMTAAAGARLRAVDLPEAAEALVRRAAFLASAMPELDLPDLAELSDVLPELCVGVRSLSELLRRDFAGALWRRLSPSQGRALRDEAPESLRLPSGVDVPIRYEGSRALAAARVQQVFGLAATPRVARGRVPIVLELTSPAGRPVAVTQDLASFWANVYPMVRKELRGRYPKHPWPEDPRTAAPTNRAKPRGPLLAAMALLGALAGCAPDARLYVRNGTASPIEVIGLPEPLRVEPGAIAEVDPLRRELPPLLARAGDAEVERATIPLPPPGGEAVWAVAGGACYAEADFSAKYGEDRDAPSGAVPIGWSRPAEHVFVTRNRVAAPLGARLPTRARGAVIALVEIPCALTRTEPLVAGAVEVISEQIRPEP